MKIQVKKQLLLLTTILLLLQGLCSCSISPSTSSVSKTGFYFDTIITITLYDCNDESYIDDCFSMAKRYETLFSNTIPESEISTINKYAGTNTPVTVSDDTLALLLLAQEINDSSKGTFDITLGQISDLWMISQLSKLTDEDDDSNTVTDYSIPSSEEINSILSSSGMDKLSIVGNEVTLENAQAKLDIGGIAKGYIADQMRSYLLSHGITTGIINLGGNIVCIGPKEDKKDYIIGIRNPFEKDQTIGSVKITEGSVVTSGIYERFITYQGVQYHHILDPQTGYPSDSNLVAVTIIGDSSAKCDALSTACLVLGETDALAYIEELDGYECILITKEKEVITSSGLDDNFSLSK